MIFLSFLVQWSNEASNGHRLLHPTFSHGSTLGLYETLTGKPFLCNIVADSVVHCFFIDRAKILSITLIHPELENFLWQVWTHFVWSLGLWPSSDIVENIFPLLLLAVSCSYLWGLYFVCRKVHWLWLKLCCPSILELPPCKSWGSFSLKVPRCAHSFREKFLSCNTVRLVFS